MNADNVTEHYLNSLRQHLSGVSPEIREEWMQEIEAHIRDAREQNALPISLVLARLGSPAQLAQEFSNTVLLRQAGDSFSPATLIRACLRLATKGIFGLIILLGALFGYALGAGLAITALCKIFLPGYVGVWVRDGRIESSGLLIGMPQPPVHDVLGWSYVPVALSLGLVAILLTTVLIQRLLRLSGSWQARLSQRGAVQTIGLSPG